PEKAAPPVEEEPKKAPAPKEDKARSLVEDLTESQEGDQEPKLEQFLTSEPNLQMVAFYLGDQEFVVPTILVNEVIRYTEPAKLPVAPPFVAGVINLRGKVTPLVHLRDILEVTGPRRTEDRFIIVCRYAGLQVGLIIETVSTMYRVPQASIDWGIEAHLGISADYVSGLLKQNDKLLEIVSVDRIVNNLVKEL
ncbi:chemotaxis protein CheW, partial [Desulfovibrio sp. OttesenSCG-928-C14]|nr:chemotaxis protein CheW [Desulfovibrio sp. OttesenSCG-928-C14]